MIDEDDIQARFGPRPGAEDFKAYGKWARPWVNGVCVDNRGESLRSSSCGVGAHGGTIVQRQRHTHLPTSTRSKYFGIS
jgi:hypothetical protein